MTFQSKRPARPVKQYDGANPSAPRAVVGASRELSAAMAAIDRLSAPIVEAPRRARRPVDPEAVHGQKIRDSARGEACQVRYVGICSHDPARTIWSHARWGAQLGDAGRGMATKAIDAAGAFACTACDAAYDQMTGAQHLTREQLDLDWCMGHFRSLGILARKGLL